MYDTNVPVTAASSLKHDIQIRITLCRNLTGAVSIAFAETFAQIGYNTGMHWNESAKYETMRYNLRNYHGSRLVNTLSIIVIFRVSFVML